MHTCSGGACADTVLVRKTSSGLHISRSERVAGGWNKWLLSGQLFTRHESDFEVDAAAGVRDMELMMFGHTGSRFHRHKSVR